MTQSHHPPKSPRSAAQRQADHRQRLRASGEHQRLTLWLDLSTYIALKRLARRDAVTQAELLTQLIRRADDAAIATLDDTKPEWDEYFRRPKVQQRHPSQGDSMP
jgi:predicted NACHT family NTPase